MNRPRLSTQSTRTKGHMPVGGSYFVNVMIGLGGLRGLGAVGYSLKSHRDCSGGTNKKSTEVVAVFTVILSFC